MRRGSSSVDRSAGRQAEIADATAPVRTPCATSLRLQPMHLYALRHAKSEYPALPNAWAERPISPVEGRDRERTSIGFGSFNPLAGAVPALPDRATMPMVSCWSGWYPTDAIADHGVYPRDFRTWQPAAWDALDEVLDWLAPQLTELDMTLVLRPHARHVLSDAQACMNFLQRHDSERLGILLDPAATLTVDMLDLAEDHLVRAFEALASHPRVPAIVLTNLEMVETGETDGGVELRTSPLHRGVLDDGLLIDLATEHGGGKPIVLLEEQLARQLALVHARLR